MSKTRVLFVCLGNICRSPLAEGLFTHHVTTHGVQDHYEIGSAGTGGWHVGNPPDPRSIAIAAQHGVDIGMQRAQQVHPKHFTNYNYLIGMDASNVERLHHLAPAGALAQIRMLLDEQRKDVPDPYYEGPEGFALVYRMVNEGTLALFKQLEARRL
ncbi:low molecular weight phosphotyrosine protein phosphatase [Pseudovibrio exalbescens]|uniref:low molecular weight protein-tyrosine-phosphatase n=1 Tax=Pseudovibrio exalbescens TaxID=197461 RepID=UPI002366CF3E|nr:low molecular weight protein-tyrosine-phosphatase [Pseudovibrio exalbescens]MDD7909438.1 low molecular weight phosphotyrosine protein phosphatase [Pseudovibrio exalbescens]